MLFRKYVVKSMVSLLVCLLSIGCSIHSENNLNVSMQEEKRKLSSVVYVQAAQGSFNHQAIKRLYKGKTGLDYRFSGTPLNTFEHAAKNDAQAFVALRNDLVPGHLVKATVEALKEYKIISVTAGVKQRIEMCLLRTQSAVEQQLALKTIASHPAALAQIGKWKAGKRYQEIEEPKGTSEAARILSEGLYADDSGVIGPKALVELYTNLVIVETGIQDREDNTTLFGQLWVQKREQSVSEQQATTELEQVIKEATALAR